MNDKSKAPSFLALVDENKELSLDNFQGSYLIIYFYPKDKTSGCTIESQDFRDYKNKFSKKNCKIIGVSRDSIKSHKSFTEKESLNFPLLSDPDETMCNAYGVMKEKSMYGRKYMGIQRTTFLSNNSGIIKNIWEKVKVPGHAEKVLKAVKELDI